MCMFIKYLLFIFISIYFYLNLDLWGNILISHILGNAETFYFPRHERQLFFFLILLSPVDISSEGSEISGHNEEPKHS